MKTALVAGATGLIGGECLRLLLAHPAYEKVVAIVRRPMALAHPKFEERVIGFESLGELRPIAADDAFCALGTTIRKAGSKDAFYAVDHDAVVNFAYWARGGGARTFAVVSSLGANASSGNFYLATKGDAEAALREQWFPHLEIFRPSVLLGNREESRPGERIAAVLLSAARPLLGGPLAKYRAIEAATVARAMIASAQTGEKGTHVREYAEILKLAGAK